MNNKKNGDNVPYTRMTGWFSPPQLLADALDIFLSYALGDRNDFRVLEAARGKDKELDDRRERAEAAFMKDGELWIDYVADVGDGWDSTYAIASLIAADLKCEDKAGALKAGPLNADPPKVGTALLPSYAEPLPFTSAGDNEKDEDQLADAVHRAVDGGAPAPDGVLRKADVLLMGGDQVYPSATRSAYDKKLVVPYLEACGYKSEERRNGIQRNSRHFRSLYAIPGNHDWYDGLTSFSRLFCQGRDIADWTTRQDKSYFALELPNPFWIFAVDIHLTADIDRPQLQYFRDVVMNRMKDGAQIILLVAEPEWLKIEEAKDAARHAFQQNLGYLEEKIDSWAKKAGRTGVSVRVRIAGDYHHYQRHSTDGDSSATDSGAKHCLVSGGGGAFLHPTHDKVMGSEEVRAGRREKERRYKRAVAFPDKETSKAMLATKLGAGLFFPFLNLSFLLIAGPLYAVLIAAMASLESGLVASALLYALLAALSPARGLAAKLSFGSLHFIPHFSAAFLVMQAAAGWAKMLALPAKKNISFVGDVPVIDLFSLLVGLVLGGFTCSMIFGVYLHLMNRFASKHGNEVFAAFRSRDYKSFLRMCIKETGAKDRAGIALHSLDIFVVGLEKCPSKKSQWRRDERAAAHEPRFVPIKGQELSPFLVEKVSVTPT